MKILKALITGIVLTTVVSCTSMEVTELPIKEAQKSNSTRLPTSEVNVVRSIGIFSPGDKLRGDLLLEQSLSDALYKKKVRNLTSSLLLKNNESRELKPVIKLLKRDKFEALMVIKNLDIASDSIRSPNATIGNSEIETLIIQKDSHPLRTLTAQIDFIDLKTQRTLWSGELTFKDTNSLPLLIQKTADGIVKHLESKQLLP